ncbi:helix-turn-helix domain-containing protein [Pyrococcus abyssi]|uniref:ArsR family transcriptional regulator n=1 Tax=Pyrococcus abyssi (strain GE5 / Orsay) TaxID=272844 RepID=Q9UZB1_PYRAB|nr:hypothetical protein [Pyrococcus abyssi]CAB50148.1 Hypothetical protein PAB0821 [Pyrococcus abyssi GE5]CCE70678.1 TPA: ArsR family transcriptional regulator [Pyrococcus abyssi GE5]
MQDSDLLSEIQELKRNLQVAFEVLAEIAQSYIRLLNLYAEYGGIGIDVAIPEIRNDPIAREIVKILFDLRRANVSQITRELKGRRGKASRNTVRAKLNELKNLGVVVEVPGERGKVYTLSKDVVKRWLDLIGIPIKLEHIKDYLR